MGPVSRAVGVLATLAGDLTRAEEYFEDALAVSRRIGAPPHVARTSVDYARLLLERGAPGDLERARSLLDEAAATAHDLGMMAVLADAEALNETAVAVASAVDRER
jgi:hypothetical protein